VPETKNGLADSRERVMRESEAARCGSEAKPFFISGASLFEKP
jgi:hypothetical protein